MEKRSDRYSEEKKSISRVNKNKILYDDMNNKSGTYEIPTYESSNEIDLSKLDMNNLNREDFQKVKDYRELIDDDKEDNVSQKIEVKKEKSYDINKILEEAKKNREKDELEGKRNISEEGSILNNLNKKYLYQKGFTEEDNEELKELIDTITSKTMVDDIKDEEEKELLSELLATTIDIKLEQELSETQIDNFVEEKIAKEKEMVDTNSFYSKSLELTAGDLLTEDEEKTEIEEDETEKENEEDVDEGGGSAKIVFISLILLIIISVVVYFVLKVLKVVD